MGQPLVSVVIAAYNAAHTIPVTLAALRRETYSPVEIIVVDDGSTDGTAAAVRQHCPEAHLLTQPNQGQPVARNAACRVARGDYIAFLDADDATHPRRLELQAEALTHHPELAFVMTGRADIGPERVVVRKWHTAGGLFPHRAEDVLRMSRLGPGASIMMRREAFARSGGFDETHAKQSPDHEFVARLFAAGGGATLRLPLYWVYASEGSFRRRYDPESFAATHFRWLDPWVRQDPGVVPESLRGASTARAARAGLVRRITWRAWVERDRRYLEAGLRQLREWGPPTLAERLMLAAAGRAISLHGRRT